MIDRFRETRKLQPYENNWLLFPAMIEAVLYRLGERFRSTPIDRALAQFDAWYVGDGLYKDGPWFCMDYYNSYVIHPFLVDLLRTVGEEHYRWRQRMEIIVKRAQRYAEIQERLVGPDGSFPMVGRSLSYRFAVFQALARMSWLEKLPPTLPPAQIRSALTAMMKRIMTGGELFDENGWLISGVCGNQPGLTERYMSVGSQYVCSTVFLPLGLPASNPFWSDPAMSWSNRRIYAGCDEPAECSLEKRPDGYPAVMPW